MDSLHIVGRKGKLAVKIGWEAYEDDATGHWIAACDSLGLTASGETHSELVSQINEVMNELLADLIEEGDLDEFLVLHGWRRDDDPPSDSANIELPWELTIQVHEASVC